MRVETVLCPVDLSPLADRLVALASSVCSCFGARLVIEHNLDTAPPASLGVSWMWSRDHRTSTSDHDHTAAHRIRECLDAVPAGIEKEARLTRGPLDETVLHLARALPADLILMGSHGWGGPHHRSLTERIIRLTRCSVLAVDENVVRDFSFLCVPEGREEKDRDIVVPVDFSAASLAVAEMASEIARDRSIGLDFLCDVDRVRGGRRRVERLRERVDRITGGKETFPVRYHVLSGNPLEGIVEFCRNTCTSLIMMATRPAGLTGLRGGGLPRALLHMSPAPVWYIPPAVWRRRASARAA